MDQSLPALGTHEPGDPASTRLATATIVSDVLLYREGLGASLARDGRVKVLDSIASVDALPSLSRHRPDAVLLDGAMTDCFQLARLIRASVLGARVVGFGISGGADRLVDCAESGLAAFVDCDGSVDDLVTAMLGALRGELACSPRVSALMCERLALLASGSRRSAALTQREKEVALLIGRGLSNKEIANYLRIEPSTVKNHVHSILEKLNVPRRSAIVHQLTPSWMNEGTRQLSDEWLPPTRKTTLCTL